jgi:hypothetical protein
MTRRLRARLHPLRLSAACATALALLAALPALAAPVADTVIGRWMASTRVG